MARLTKSDIEQKLLMGLPVEWRDAGKKINQLVLGDPKARRLFAFLLGTKVREPTGLSQIFIDGLSSSYSGTDDPASKITVTTAAASSTEPWCLQSIETEDFGGLNIWGGPPFHFDFDRESLLLEGPNGSGKSSLIGAVLWALSGDRPRDQTDSTAHETMPVLGNNDKTVGEWPPIACYPPSETDLKSPPHVRVTLTFQDPQGGAATVERTLDGGKIKFSTSPEFNIPSILLETGLLMPARLALLRLDGGAGRLTDAVQKLTGLDDLIDIGLLVEGLCHRAREYLSSKQKELKPVKIEFDHAIKEVRDFLSAVQVPLPDFTPAETNDDKGAMAQYAKMLSDKATEHTQVVSNDLGSSLNLASPLVQNQVISAIGAAQEDLKTGLEGLASWKTLQTISQALDDETTQRVSAAIVQARCKADEAVRFLEKSTQDSKFQLKAVAAQWHTKHMSGAVENCPLCEQDLKAIPLLAQELEELRSAGDASARMFDDNLNAILMELESSLPASIKNRGPEILILEPRAKLTDEIRASLVFKDRYAEILVKFGALVEAALPDTPVGELAAVEVPTGTDILKILDERIAVIERLLGLAAWFNAHSKRWSEWWQNLAGSEVSKEADITSHVETKNTSEKSPSELLSAHLLRLSDALAKAEPYRKAAESIRTAWKSGKAATVIEKELKLREAIAESMMPLKNLGPLAEFVAREAINGLSGRISELLKRIYLAESLQFHDAQLRRKKGLVVLGGFAPDLHIDATLVANTSWLRAVMWAFLFSLREEVVEQLGTDPFPILLFDDPQTTFDNEHRHRWTQYIISMQKRHLGVQIIITTSDRTFLDLAEIEGISGRRAMIASANPDLKHVGIFEGGALDRKWAKTLTIKTPQAGLNYIQEVRIYVEGLLRLMLRGEDPLVMSVANGFSIGASRKRLDELNKKGIAPWNRSVFEKLVSLLDNKCAAIKYMEMSHHSSGSILGMAEAIDVEKHWKKPLRQKLEGGYRIARNYQLLHGGSKALYASEPTVVLPEGYQANVRKIPLQVLGRAAAFSDGRIADGRLDPDEFSLSALEKIELTEHLAYRVTVRTLEPVARPGDILLVKGPEEPPAKSLVVALNEDRILARRYEISENHSDIAVLTSQTINPFQIAPPVVAHKATLTSYKVIGVLYEEGSWTPPGTTEMEVCDCGGEAVLLGLTVNIFGLVEVVGQSAEPYALNGQYLLLKKEINSPETFRALDGRPIIAADTDDNRYFKRLRIAENNLIVLESLESSGDYGPVVLSSPGKGKNCLERVWPVAGVLFELPN